MTQQNRPQLRPLAATLAVATTALAAVLASPAAHATGVAAGTAINNVATATYSTGTGTGTVTSNTVTVKVAELLNVAVAPLTSTPVAAGSNAAVLSFQVTNTGNGSEAFNLTANPTVAGNAFNGTIQQVVIDSNGNGTYDPGTDTVITNGSASAALPADGNVKVFVVVNLPAGVTDTQVSQVRLSAVSTTGSGNPGTLFAGKGDGGVDAVVGASHADQNALASLVASLATISLTKSATIADTFGGTAPLPGATVTYTLIAHATGTGTATGVHVTDAIPTGTTYQGGTLTLNGTGLTDAADADAGTGSASGIDVTLGTMAGGSADKTVTFQVKIN
ncbi:MAG: DUF11 domain-containing protein [Sphingomonadales bacterium]|nr:DUF11 domain-containing protein [Sphingomonadales bacterium]